MVMSDGKAEDDMKRTTTSSSSSLMYSLYLLMYN